MAFNVDNIIPISYTINPTGLGVANFASAVLFAPSAELPGGFAEGDFRTYSSTAEVSADFSSSTETYKAAAKWLGGIPATSELVIYGTHAAMTNWTDELNAARTEKWWFFSFFTAAVYADTGTDVPEIAAWCEDNRSFFVNCQTGSSATDIRAGTAGNIAEDLTLAGYRFTHTCSHATDAYAGIALMKWFAAVNYSGTNTVVTGEYKKLSGVVAEDLTSTAYANMSDGTIRSGFYTVVDNQGSTDIGRYINSITHSSYGEWVDYVINLEALLNAIRVARYNAVTSNLGMDPQGQAALDGSTRAVCEQFITNGFLGPRTYIDPDDGQEKFTAGYEILSKPEDILNISDADRNARKAATLRLRVFRKGFAHVADVTMEVL